MLFQYNYRNTLYILNLIENCTLIYLATSTPFEGKLPTLGSKDLHQNAKYPRYIRVMTVSIPKFTALAAKLWATIPDDRKKANTIECLVREMPP